MTVCCTPATGAAPTIHSCNEGLGAGLRLRPIRHPGSPAHEGALGASARRACRGISSRFGFGPAGATATAATRAVAAATTVTGVAATTASASATVNLQVEVVVPRAQLPPNRYRIRLTGFLACTHLMSPFLVKIAAPKAASIGVESAGRCRTLGAIPLKNESGPGTRSTLTRPTRSGIGVSWTDMCRLRWIFRLREVTHGKT